MNDYLLENAKFYHPHLTDHAVNYHEVNRWELVIELDDGLVFMYDDWDRSIRKLPRDCFNMSEEECKREFGMRLRSLMFRKNVTQVKLSEMTGIPQPSISNYMKGKASPSFYNVDRIAKALNCSIDELRYIR